MEPCEYWDEDGCYCVCGAMCSCVYDPDGDTPSELQEEAELLRNWDKE